MHVYESVVGLVVLHHVHGLFGSVFWVKLGMGGVHALLHFSDLSFSSLVG